SWTQLGVSASPFADSRHTAFLEALRSGGSWQLDETADFAEDVRSFVASLDMVAISGWDVREEPIILLAAVDLVREAAKLTSIYPDGFILTDPSFTASLIVDWDKDHQQAFVRLSKLGSNAQN
ncbi:MAG TPA: hypothetical protein VNT42_13550, partial [Sphingomonas sp.]|nr:hypothetical protein [Sphingomonas sp.]